MLRISIIILLILPVVAKSNSTSDTSKVKRFFIGVSAGPNGGYRHLSKNKTSNDPNIQSVINSRNSSEVMSLGYTAGVDVLYQLKPHWFVKSGLNYTKYAFHTKKINLSTAVPDPTIPSYVQSYYYTSLIELPLSIGYTVKSNRFSFTCSIGPGICYFAGKGYFMLSHYNDGSNKKTLIPYNIHENTISMNSIVAASINYSVTSRIIIRIEPAFKYMITPLNNDPIQTRLYSYNGILGVMLRL